MREELELRPAAQVAAESNLPRPRRHRHLEDASCQVDGDHRSLTHGFLLSTEHALMTPTTVALRMPTESREEPISSLERTRWARSARIASRQWCRAVQLQILWVSRAESGLNWRRQAKKKSGRGRWAPAPCAPMEERLE